MISIVVLKGNEIMRKPLYKIIYDDIKFKIQSKVYKVGDKLPSEQELETLYQFSRTPVRQALNELEKEGHIYRLQGKGSFVSNISSTERWTMTTGFGSQYSREWRRISAKTLYIGYIKSEFYAGCLSVKKEANIIHLKRIRYYNGIPLVYMEHYIKPIVPIDVFTKDHTFVSAAGKIIKDELNIKFTKINEELEAIIADENLSNNLKIKIGEPLLKISRYSYYKEELIDINIYFIKTDNWKFKINYEEN